MKLMLFVLCILCLALVESSYKNRKADLVQKIELGLEKIRSKVGKKICPEQYDMYMGNGGAFCYKIITEFCKNWTSAREFCLAEGADLITFTEKNFEEFRENLKDLYYIHEFDCGPYAWVGVTDVAKEGTWLYVTGTSLAENSALWAHGEPGLGSSGKNCGALDGNSSDFFMVDEDCKHHAIPICQLYLPHF